MEFQYEITSVNLDLPHNVTNYNDVVTHELITFRK